MAGKIFVGMTGVKFTLETEIDITGATTREIKWIKKDGTTGEWTAIEEGDPTDGNISFTTTSVDDLDIAGKMIFWAHIIHSDSTVSYGEAEGHKIYNQGK